MNDIEVRETIFNHVADNFTLCQVAWPEENYDPDPQTAYLEPSIEVYENPMLELGGAVGNRAIRREGMLSAVVRVPVSDSNQFRAHIYAMNFRDLFELRVFGDLTFQDAKCTPLPVADGWQMAHMTCIFQFQEIK